MSITTTATAATYPVMQDTPDGDYLAVKTPDGTPLHATGEPGDADLIAALRGETAATLTVARHVHLFEADGTSTHRDVLRYDAAPHPDVTARALHHLTDTLRQATGWDGLVRAIPAGPGRTVIVKAQQRRPDPLDAALDAGDALALLDAWREDLWEWTVFVEDPLHGQPAIKWRDPDTGRMRYAVTDDPDAAAAFGQTLAGIVADHGAGWIAALPDPDALPAGFRFASDSF